MDCIMKKTIEKNSKNHNKFYDPLYIQLENFCFNIFLFNLVNQTPRIGNYQRLLFFLEEFSIPPFWIHTSEP